MNLNRVMLAGRLTRDPELKYTTGGIAVCEFGIAVTETWKDKKSGEKREDVCFVDVSAFNKTAETISSFFKKGDPIFVDGKLKLQQWEGKTGNKMSKHTIKLETFQFIGSNRGKDKPKAGNEQQCNDIPDEEIPF